MVGIFPRDDPVARLHGRAAFFLTIENFWSRQRGHLVMFQPKINGQVIDLYTLFEVARAFGGLHVVSASPQFSHLKFLLDIPSNVPVYYYHIRECYIRYCIPCEDILLDAVEDIYQRLNLHSTRPSWVFDRLFNPAPIPSERPNSKNPHKFDAIPSEREAHSMSSKDDQHSHPNMEDHAKDSVRKHPEATRAVIRARMNVNTLEESEKKSTFLSSTSTTPTLHLDLRNHIIRMWYRNPSTRLVIRTAVQDIPDCYHDFACQVFTFLVCQGTINFGAIPFPSPHLHADRNVSKRVCVIGAGISGLITARQLRSFGISVTICEAKNRTGGRIYTEKSKFSAPVDLGAMIITGATQNPLSILAEQTSCETHTIGQGCPIFDIDGSWVSTDVDKRAQQEFNAVLAATERARREVSEPSEPAEKVSLGVAFQNCLMERVLRRQDHTRRIHSKVRSGLTKVSGTEDRDDEFHANGNYYGDEAFGKVDEMEVKRSQGNEVVEEEGSNTRNPSTVRRSRRKRKSVYTQYDTTGNTTSNRNTDVGRRRSDRLKVQRFLPSVNEDRTFDGKGTNREAFQNIEHDTKIGNTMSRGETSAYNPETCSNSNQKNDHVVERLINWHIANLEYACGASVDAVSLRHWDQDDPYSFQGDHLFSKQGFQPFVDGLLEGLEQDIQLNTEVFKIRRSNNWDHVVVETRPTNDGPCISFNSTETTTSATKHSKNLQSTNENSREGLNKPRTQSRPFDAVVVTVPLGVLKDERMVFDPPLPLTKQNAIKVLGTGGLIKVAMEFQSRFWDENDSFGALRNSIERRGSFYIFWNMEKSLDKPILVGLIAEPAAKTMTTVDDDSIVKEAMAVLRRQFLDAPGPISYAVTRWSEDRFIRGTYSYIPVGSSGTDYDTLAEPVSPYIFFAGEHTCRTNPGTCGSGILSGLREANRIAEQLGIVQRLAHVHRAELHSCSSDLSTKR